MAVEHWQNKTSLGLMRIMAFRQLWNMPIFEIEDTSDVRSVMGDNEDPDCSGMNFSHVDPNRRFEITSNAWNKSCDTSDSFSQVWTETCKSNRGGIFHKPQKEVPANFQTKFLSDLMQGY